MKKNIMIRKCLAALLCLALMLGTVPAGLSETRQEQMMQAVEEIMRQRQSATATPEPTATPAPAEAPEETQAPADQTASGEESGASQETEATPAPEGQPLDKQLAMLKKGTAVYLDAGLQKRLGVLEQRGVVYVFELLDKVLHIGLVSGDEVLEGYVSADRGTWLSAAEVEAYQAFLGRNARPVGTQKLIPVQLKKDEPAAEAAQTSVPVSAGDSAPRSAEEVIRAAQAAATQAESVPETPAEAETEQEESADETAQVPAPAAEETAQEESSAAVAAEGEDTADEVSSDFDEEDTVQPQAGSETSDTDDESAPLEVRLAELMFQLQPKGQVVMAGDLACFTVAAQGATAYQWQYRANGGDWTNLQNGNVWKGLNTATLSFNAKNAWNNWEFRCAATGGGQTVYSDSAVLLVNTAGLSSLTILKHPAAQSVSSGARAVFTISAVNATGYQWQYRAGSSGSWTNLSNGNVWIGNKTNTLTFTAKASWNGWQFRCAAIRNGETVYSNAAELTVKSSAPVISAHPAAQTVDAGKTAIYSVTATGAESYQWQYTSDGTTWTNLSNSNVWIGNKTSTLVFTAKAAWNGWQFRCAVKNASDTVYSRAALLTVNQLAEVSITTQPAAQTVKAGATATFSVTAVNATAYQWQYSTDGSTWTNLSNGNVWIGNKTKTLTFTVKAAWNGWRFRCVASNSTGKAYSSSALLTVIEQVSFTSQPVSVSVREGATATFSAGVTGAANLQWQYSANGTNWINLTEGGGYTGVKTAQLSFTASLDLNGYRFRLKASSSLGTTYSNAVTLTVTGKVAISAHPASVTASAGDTVTFSMKADNATGYIWQYKASGSSSWESLQDKTGISGSRTDTLTIQVTSGQLGGQFRCRVTDGTDVLYTNAATLNKLATAPVFTAPATTSLQAAEGSSVTIAPQVSGATSYQWQFTPASLNYWTNMTESATFKGTKTAELTVSVSAITSGYLFRLKATNSYGTSYSEIYTITLSMAGPTNIKASALSRTSVSISWTAPSSGTVTGYKVYYNTTKNTSSASTVTVKTTSATLSGLTAGTTYYIWVQAYNSSASSPLNDSVMTTVKTQDAQTKPGAPTSVAASASTTTVTVTWKAPANSEVSGYYVYYKKTGAASSSKITVTGSTTLTATVTGLTKSTSYQVWVSAYNDAGEGTASAKVTVSTLASSPQPEQPTNVRAVTSGMSSVRVSWEASVTSGVTGYYVYYSKSADASTAVRFGGLVSSIYYVNVTGLIAGTKYYFWVTARGEDGTESAMNDSVRATATPAVESTDKVSAQEFSMMGDKYIGASYSTMDCQAFVERMLRDVGIYLDLAGSNTWYRYITWRGTPEECIRKFGRIPTGAFLFIVENDGGEPSQFRSDGLGNASHMGVVIHREDGAIHSSYSRGKVCYSYFADATVPNGGWNRVGLWIRLDYGEDINEKLEEIVSSR